jgi:hypothetical protein
LSDSDLKELYESINEVLERGLEFGGASELAFVRPDGTEGNYQDHALVYGKQGQICSRCKKEKIKKFVLGGRGRTFVKFVKMIKDLAFGFEFSNKVFEFSDGISVILGENASGKTNILEALYLISTGKSFKAKVEEEMISYAEEIGRVKAKCEETLEVMLTRGEINIGTTRTERAPRKKLLVNGVPRRLLDFAGNFQTVLFGPWDLELVVSAPSVRRRFLDSVISQVDREYRRAILSYEKGLRQRNRLLLRIRGRCFEE